MTSHAFIDESVRGPNCCLCATLVPVHGLLLDPTRGPMSSTSICPLRASLFSGSPMPSLGHGDEEANGGP